jgi:hypothetical protein
MLEIQGNTIDNDFDRVLQLVLILILEAEGGSLPNKTRKEVEKNE